MASMKSKVLGTPSPELLASKFKRSLCLQGVKRPFFPEKVFGIFEGAEILHSRKLIWKPKKGY